MNLDEFYEEINNSQFLAHYKSSVREVHNDSIGKLFWTDNKIRNLPYQRGFIFAFYLDNQIRLGSNNTKTLRDFLLDLKMKANSKEDSLVEIEGPLTLKEFMDVGAQYMDKESLQFDVEKYVIEGKLIDFSKVTLLDAFLLEYDAVDKTPSVKLREDIKIKDLYSY